MVKQNAYKGVIAFQWKSWRCEYIQWFWIQIVMVSPGTHLVKNIESQSRSNDSQIEDIYIQVCNWKCLGLCVTRQLICLISLTDSKLCITAVLKLKYSPSKGSRKYASFNNSHNNCHRIHKRDISTNTHVQFFYSRPCINRSPSGNG